MIKIYPTSNKVVSIITHYLFKNKIKGQAHVSYYTYAQTLNSKRAHPSSVTAEDVNFVGSNGCPNVTQNL